MIDLDAFFARLDALCPDRLSDQAGWREITIPPQARPMIGELITDFSGFIGNKVKQYAPTPYSHNLTFNDLWQEAAIGFIVAIWKYNPDHGLFVSFACKWIQAAIYKAIFRTGYMIRLPERHNDHFAISPLDHKIKTRSIPVETMAANNDYRNYLIGVLGKLPAKEADVVIYRFGLVDGQELPYKDIAVKYGLTKRAIQYIEKRALTRLRLLLEADQTVL